MTNRVLNISDEERALLTDEELAGMMEGQEFDEGQPEPEAGAQTQTEGAQTNTDDDDDDDQDGKKPDADDEQAAADAAAADAQAQGRDDGAQEEQQQQPVAPTQTYTQLPDDFEQQVSNIEAAKNELYTKFDEGDLTTADYAKQLDELNKQERALERLRDRAEYDQQQRWSNWANVTVAGFLSNHPEYSGNDMLMGLLDQEVRKLQQQSDTFDNPQYLADAHAKISGAFPQIFGASTTDSQDKKADPPAKPRTVPTLAGVPAASIDQPGDNKFAQLDDLAVKNPLKYEAELERMRSTNPALYDEYMAT